MYRTSGDAKSSIVLYDYQPNRKAENTEQFLTGFTGWFHADGYRGTTGCRRTSVLLAVGRICAEGLMRR